MTSRIYSILLSIAGFFATLTFGFAVPIVCRPFYYMQISLLNLEETTGFSRETIRAAYDELMDYLLKGQPFGTGSLAWSPSGKSHFEDCLFLFHLDFAVLFLSLGIILLLFLLWRFKKIRIHRFHGQSPFFYTGIFNILLFAFIGLWGIFSFDTMFVAFHTAFFPGKSNWIFDPNTDEIIRILPEQFFFNCAALILLIIFALSIFYIVQSVRSKNRGKNS
ncbi:MAG: TIGR01906 family membrane protein [Ruminococcus sp.]|jgi:integral membrane protein (TIGR01906 family)